MYNARLGARRRTGGRDARLGWAGAADGGGRRWGHQARTVGVDLLTSARPETIHRGSDNVAKTQEGWPLPKRTDCACKKTQDLMPTVSRNHLKVL